MKKLIFICFVLGAIFSSAAQDLNEYKYVIVPQTYDFMKREDQYQLNSLTKFLFEKYGFEAVMKDEDRPEDLRKNNCLGLRADVKNNSGIFVTKMKVLLEDCNGNVVFESEEGRSRTKQYKQAWQEALRDAFNSVAALDHNYEADPVVETVEKDAPSAETPEAEAEVAKSLPAEVQVRAQPVAMQNQNAQKYYVKDNAVFYLKDSDDGYSFYQKGMAEPFAALIKSDKGKTYIYNSLTKQGMAYFDESGNLVVEYFDRNQNKSVKTVYELQAQ
ncbi:MAG: hypothetical protein WAM00_05655 [Salegentibacter sp.]